jgi:hypothetical protein
VATCPVRTTPVTINLRQPKGINRITGIAADVRVEVVRATQPQRIRFDVPPPSRPVPPEDVVLPIPGLAVDLLPGKAERLVIGGAGAEGGDGAVWLVLHAPVDGARCVGAKQGSAEMVGEGPVGSVAGNVELGDGGAGEPEIFVGEAV